MGQVKRLTSHTQKTHKSINPVSKRAPRAGAQCFIAKLIHFQEISHELETCSVKTYTIPSINLLYEYILYTFLLHIYHFSSPSHGCRKTTSNIYIAQSFCMCVIQNTKQCNTHLSSLSSSPQNTTNTQFMRPLNYRLQIHIYTFMGTRNHFSIHTFILYMDISCTTQKG